MTSNVLNFVIEKALQSTCLVSSINGCEVLLLIELQYLNNLGSQKGGKLFFVVEQFSLNKEFKN